MTDSPASLTVLVTGASGFVGSHLAQALVDDGHDVRAMTRHPETYDGAGKAVAGDVSDAASLESVMQGVDVGNGAGVRSLGEPAESGEGVARRCVRLDGRERRIVHVGKPDGEPG